MSVRINSSRRLLLSRGVLTVTIALLGVGSAWLWNNHVLAKERKDSSADLMAAELQRAAARADICTAANAVGVGLQGEYFSEPLLRGQAVLVRVDQTVDFDASIKQPTDSGRLAASVRWSGWIKPPMTGKYRFHADAPDMQIMVARNLVAGAGAPLDEKVELAAGRFYPVEVIVNKIADSDARFKLEWTAPHGARYVVPRALLHLPTESVAASNR